MTSRMTPVDQGPGQCWTACAAGLTGIPLEDFPLPPAVRDTETENAYTNAVRRFLKSRGWLLQTTWTMAPKGYAIASGPSPRGEGVDHCVVMLGGRLVHDPHPSRAGLAGPVEEYEVLIELADAVP